MAQTPDRRATACCDACGTPERFPFGYDAIGCRFVPEQLREEMTLRGMTVRSLAAASGLSTTTIEVCRTGARISPSRTAPAVITALRETPRLDAA